MIPQSLPPPPAAAATAVPSGTFNLSMLLRSMRKHWVLMILSLALCMGGAAAYTSTQVRIYEATATVQLDPQPLMPLGHRVSPGTELGPEGYWSNVEYFQTQQQIITSRRVAMLVVKKLGLDRDAGFLLNRPASNSHPPMTATVEQAAESLRARITVKPVRDSRLTEVSLRDADPDRAYRVLSALLDVYVDQNLDTSLESANKTGEWLDTQLLKLKTDLEAQEMELHDFKKRNNLLSVSFDDQSNMLRAQIQQLNTKLTELKTQKEHVAARLAVLQSIKPEDPATIPQTELLGSLIALRERFVGAAKDLSRLQALGKGEGHPEVLAAQAQVDITRTALLGEINNVRDGVATDLAAVQRELAGVSTLYETAKQQALGLNLNELRYSRLRRSKDNTERVFGMVLERSSESGLSKVMPFNNVRVLDRPLRPGGPVLPRPMANLAFGAALGVLLAFAGALGRELLDRTVRSVEDLEQELGLPSLGSLPDAAGKGHDAVYGAYYGKRGTKKKKSRDGADTAATEKPELLVHNYPKSAISEAARALVTNLVFMSPDRPFKTLLVTSAGPSEGKTTVATSISIALSQTGRSVCLVDCDLRRPRVHTLFGRDARQGVSNALLDASRLDEAITETQVPNLSVLPAGPTLPNPADLMHSDAFGRVLDTLKSRFDVVILDSPPVCVVTDAAILSTRTDATVLVVRALRTKREAARRALRALRDVGANCVGFVMNASNVHGDSYQYSYYRYEHRDEPEGAAPAKA